jgi:probable phosphomutase (TIGR03848 family)
MFCANIHPMGTIILVRHGENDWSKKNKLAGHLPGVHLNENGHQQAQAVAQRLAGLPVKAIYSSPVTRCLETAGYIADTHRLPILQLNEVAEVHYGDWEGKKIKKLAKEPLWRAVQFFPSRARFPQGEALREVQFRAVQALEEISRKHEKDLVVVVSHADIIRLLLAHYLGIHIDLFQRIVIAPASASVIALSSEGMVRVLRMNDDGPLHMPAAEERKKPRKKDKRARVTEYAPAVGVGEDGQEKQVSSLTAFDEEE